MSQLRPLMGWPVAARSLRGRRRPALELFAVAPSWRPAAGQVFCGHSGLAPAWARAASSLWQPEEDYAALRPLRVEAISKRLPGTLWLIEEGYMWQADGGILVAGGINALRTFGTVYVLNQRLGSKDPKELPQATAFFKVGRTSDMEKRTASLDTCTPFANTTVHSVVVPDSEQLVHCILGMFPQPEHFDGGSEWRIFAEEQVEMVKMLMDDEQTRWHDLKMEVVPEHAFCALMATHAKKLEEERLQKEDVPWSERA